MLSASVSALSPAHLFDQAAQKSARHWDGAAVLDLVQRPRGTVRHEYAVVKLQRWATPLEVRVHGDTTWQRFLPEARLWLPGEEQHNEWRGTLRSQVVLLTVAHIERTLEQPYHTTHMAAWRGRHFDTPHLAGLLHALSARSPAATASGADVLLTRLIDWLAHGPEGPPATRRPSRLTPARLALLKDYIEAHLAEPLSLERLAATAGCSPRLLGTAFKAATGRSPHQYVLERRVSEAQLLLHQGADDLCGIAAQVGFTDQSQFSKTFRRFTGRTPSDFRASRATWLMPATSTA